MGVAVAGLFLIGGPHIAYYRFRYHCWDTGEVPRAYAVFWMDRISWPSMLPEFETGMTDAQQFVRHDCAMALARRGRIDGLRGLSSYGHWVKMDGERDLRSVIPGLPPLDPGADIAKWFDDEIAPAVRWTSEGWVYGR